MATSIHKGRLLTGRAFDANAALDARFVRDVVANNALHYADEAGQVLVNWTPTGTSFDSGQAAFTQETPVIYDTWQPVVSFGPFSLRLRQNGDSYRLRIRVAGASAVGEGVGKLRVVVCPAGEASSLVQVDGDHVYETEETNDNTSVRWLDGASLGSNAWDTMIYAPSSMTSGWLTTTSTLDSIGGSAVGVEQCLVHVNVYAMTTASAASDEPGVALWGLYVAEYIGT